MAARLAATVYVTDPETHQTVELAPGTSPDARLAALVTNPAAWVDRKVPRLPKKQDDQQTGDRDPTGDGQDDASGAASADADQEAAPAAKKTAARKTAATGRSRGRDAAGEGTSGE
ncbi:hypothetical protein DMH12_15510 [Streptomyces sp. WAC 04229]|uniref:hypothetical protein n=1 Tax=Streptomyces sp. WAC 04229 TaxID=2203206 RepID=UPI000F73819A|nr:hypothetical protein [Streptomyces sp. WAC 04229]RSN55622.1 hypothetical protein DMH12_15510 [Streptomyces sp. WAC 04229]